MDKKDTQYLMIDEKISLYKLLKILSIMSTVISLVVIILFTLMKYSGYYGNIEYEYMIVVISASIAIIASRVARVNINSILATFKDIKGD